MAKVTVYSSANCPYCVRAKALLDKKQVQYEEVRVDINEERRAEMMEITGRRTVPQIIINGQPIGGFDDMWLLEQQGRLDPLLSE